MMQLPFAAFARQYFLLAYVPVFVIGSFLQRLASNVDLFINTRTEEVPGQLSRYLSLVELAPMLEDFRLALTHARTARRMYCVGHVPVQHVVVRTAANPRGRLPTPRANARANLPIVTA